MSTAVDSRPRASRFVRSASARARSRNQRILAVVRPDSDGKLPFLCECGMRYCQDSVWLTLHEARNRIERGQKVIGAHFFRELEARLNR